MYDLKELNTWKCARKLRKDVSRLSKSFPKCEFYRLTDQVIRSSRSVSANIAEGYGRYHYQDSIRFFVIARGSLFETQDHLLCASDEEFLSDEDLSDIENTIENCHKLINGYISFLKKSKASGSDT